MKLKSKNKGMILLKLLLMVFFSGVSHRIVNTYAWDQLKDIYKLNSIKKTFISAKSAQYLNPDEIDGGEGRHLNVNFCNSQANSFASKVVTPTNLVVGQQHSLSEKNAYHITAALHYVQDMSCPVHHIAAGEKLHNAYELKPDAFGISACSDTSCPSFTEVNSKISAQNTVLNGITTANGSVFTSQSFKNHILNRYNGWLNDYNAWLKNPSTGNTSKIKTRLLEDLAFACCVSKRFWKGNNLNFWFK